MQLTVTRGDAPRPTPPRPKRLQLGAARFAVLASAAPGELPPPFATLAAALPAPADVPGVWSELTEIGVADGTRPVPAVATTLGLLTGAPFAVQLLAGTADRGVAAWWSLDGERGAGLRLLPGGAVEVSAFAAQQWQREVTRAVPSAQAFEAPGRGSIAAGLGGASASAAPQVGRRAHRLSLAALSAVLGDPDAPPTSERVDPALAAALANPAARLQATVLGRLGAGTATGTVSWAAAPGGWLALRRDLRTVQDGGAPAVDVVPVQPADLARELTPLLLAGVTRFADTRADVPTATGDDVRAGTGDDVRAGTGDDVPAGTEGAPQPTEDGSGSPAAPGDGGSPTPDRGAGQP